MDISNVNFNIISMHFNLKKDLSKCFILLQILICISHITFNILDLRTIIPSTWFRYSSLILIAIIFNIHLPPLSSFLRCYHHLLNFHLSSLLLISPLFFSISIFASTSLPPFHPLPFHVPLYYSIPFYPLPLPLPFHFSSFHSSSSSSF